jgi:serine/threonine protein kinase
VQFYLASILEGLEELHSKRHIVHMDIKPENILLNGRGYAAITDLGCAVQLSDAEAGEYRVFPGGTWSEEATRCPAAAARPPAYASRRGTVNDLWLAAVRCARNAGSIFRPRSWAVEMWAAYRRRSQTVPHLIS